MLLGRNKEAMRWNVLRKAFFPPKVNMSTYNSHKNTSIFLNKRIELSNAKQKKCDLNTMNISFRTLLQALHQVM